MNHEIRNIIRGTKSFAKSDFIQTIRHHLSQGKAASGTTQKSKFFSKKDEEQLIINYINQNKHFICNEIIEQNYITEGAEQKVYLHSDELHVLKMNDSIFYEYWDDYFINLLIHNYLFPSTAYELVGFINHNGLYAVVKQLYVQITEPTDLEFVKEFLKNNKFKNTKNNDYVNTELGIILEDLHDENVITSHGVLFFIDTVFYVIPN